MIGLLFGVHKCTECRSWIFPWDRLGYRLSGVRYVAFHPRCVGWSA